MQPITEYKAENDKLRLLLQGPSGAGKTTLACQFPKPYIVDIDVNLGGSLRFLKEKGLQLPVGFDVIDRDKDGKPLDIKQRYLRLNECLLSAQIDPNIETIVLDSGTTLADVLIAEILRQQGKNAVADFKDGRQFWGFFAILGRQFMATLTAMRKHIVLVVHEKILTSADGSVVYPVKVAWPGQVGQNIGIFFTNVWRAEVQAVPVGMQTNYKWQIRTMPEFRYELKNSLGLPPLFEFNWSTIAEKLK
jgi:AAA domain-containing protein